MSFSASDLARVDAAVEVEIETRSPGGDVHRTVIWAVVGGDAVYVRSYRGRTARWFREVSADPLVALLVDGDRIPVRATLATDPASIAACSAGLAAKYADDPSLGAMLAPEIVDTTLRLDAA